MSDPLWYKDAIIYQTHVKAFYDASGDGVGDFRGLTQKLDYLQNLGVTAVWILPFYPSPLRDDGYDIADYLNVHPAYGTLRDFKAFLKEAHERGLKVITELVINHTSDQHPWFQRARKAKPGSRWRDYYVWSDTQDRYRDARIIFQDFEASNWSWDAESNAYYWHRFYHHQPDLNFDNPEVRKAVIEFMDYWLDMGVDGLRLDAVPYLFEREGTNCENLPETHEFLKALRAHIDKKFENRMLLAEANQWPEDAVAYFGEGNECHTAFHFPVMPRLFMAVHMEDRFPIIDILEQTPPVPDNCQWVLFLRNHDELTLEMVTDEERDYMYRMYARDPQARINLGIRRRLAPLMGNNRRKIELLNGLLFSLPGTPVIYYGDEIGMGDNIYLGDRDGVRTPMQWSADRNAGFSRANPQQLYLPVIIDHEYHYEAINVETQYNNSSSLFWWMKRMIALRQQFQVFGRGTIEFLFPENAKVLAFVRHYEDQDVMVVANLSRFSQYVELDMSAYRGRVPVEMLGGIRFPRIGELPYLLTLGAYAFYWFLLEKPAPISLPPSEAPEAAAAAPPGLPTVTATGEWHSLVQGPRYQQLERVLPGFFQRQRWFAGKARTIRGVGVHDVVPLRSRHGAEFRLTFARVDYAEGEPDIYLIPLGFLSEQDGRYRDLQESPAAIARVQLRGSTNGLLFDAMGETGLGEAFLESIAGRKKALGNIGRLAARSSKAFRSLRGDSEELSIHLLGAEQSNSAMVFGDKFLLKLFRRLDEGTNPDLEIGAFLTEQVNYPHTPPVGGWIVYDTDSDAHHTVAILQGYVRNEGDAWKYTLDLVARYFERVLTEYASSPPPPSPPGSLVQMSRMETPPLAENLCGNYLELAELLGRRTAELHLALNTRTDDPAFAPEEFTRLYQRSIYQSARSQLKRNFRLLQSQRKKLPEDVAADAERLLARQSEIEDRFRWLLGEKIKTTRIRVHGDYHLGQVLYTGKDFVIIDFEGEPARPISERRIKRSPLRDVAGMLRSFEYACFCALTTPLSGLMTQSESQPALESWAVFWSSWTGAAFLRAYLQTTGQASFVPAAEEDLLRLLELYLMDKAIYELGYELNNRPDWVRVPLRGILQLLEFKR